MTLLPRLALVLALVAPVACTAVATAPAHAGSAPANPASLFTADNKALPPAPYKGIVPGMTKPEAVKLMPELAKQNYSSTKAYGDVSFFVSYADDKTTIDSLWISLPAAGKDWPAGGWGPGVNAKGKYDDKETTYWWAPDKGIRADLKEGYDGKYKLNFSTYTPFTTFVGAEGQDLAFLAGTEILGMAPAAVGEKFPKNLIARYKENEKSVTRPWGEIADPKPSLTDKGTDFYLEFGPTELGAFTTRVNMSFDDKTGVIDRYYVTIPYLTDTATRDQIIAVLKAKWGEGKQIKTFMDTATLVRSAPYVSWRDKGDGDLQITVETKNPAR